MIRFARGMEDGDMLTITGMVYDKANMCDKQTVIRELINGSDRF